MGEITYPRTDGLAESRGPLVGEAWGPDGGVVVVPVENGLRRRAYRFRSAPRYGMGWVRVRIVWRPWTNCWSDAATRRVEGFRLRASGAPAGLWTPLSEGRVPQGYLEMPLPPCEPANPAVPRTVLVPGDAEPVVEWFRFVYVAAELRAGGWEPYLFPLPAGTFTLCHGDIEVVEAAGPFEPWVWW